MAEEIVDNKFIKNAFRLMTTKDYDSAEEELKKGYAEAVDIEDDDLLGLFFSAFGVLYKLRGDFKKSYKFYQQAEKLLPENHSLKIITSILLIEQFKQYDTAVRKLEKILQSGITDPAIKHHVLLKMALGYFKMSEKDKAKACFENVIASDFNELRSALNIDFKTVEAFVEKEYALDRCEKFLNKALKLAKSKKEANYIKMIEALLKGLKKLPPH